MTTLDKIQKDNSSVFTTDDYGLFKFKEGNRPINHGLVKKLYKSICKYGWFKSSVIIVGDGLVVLDGQHRLEALKMFQEKNGVKYNVKYVVDREMDDLKRITAWQTERSAWTNDDYANSYIKQGNGKYVAYKEFRDKYKLNHAISLRLLANASTGFDLSAKFKAGKIRIFSLVLSKKMAENLNEIKPLYPYYQHQTFVSAMISLWNNPDFNHDYFVKSLQKNRDALYRVGTSVQYKRLIEDIYNKGKHNKVRFE